MANKKAIDKDYDLAGELEAATDGSTQYAVLTGHQPLSQCDLIERTYLISRCVFEALQPQPKPTDPEVRSALKCLRGILREARERGVAYICCYHVDGGAGWYMKWSDDYDWESAAQTMLMAMFTDGEASLRE